MSIQAITWAIKQVQLPATEWRVLIVLANNHSFYQRCVFSYVDLINLTVVANENEPEEALHTALTNLSVSGLIELHQPIIGYSPDELVYRLPHDKDWSIV